ncbi:MAG: hypothetical protein L0215_22145 [Gemmataceae bacterium]|nr:hypothetical protein [Gemmataceae bacterium]
MAILLPYATASAGPPAARLRSPQGTLLVQSGKTWALPALHDGVAAGVEVMALPGARAILEAKEGDVRLVLAGNLPDLSISPAFESVVTLHEAGGSDLDFTLERGRVILENQGDGPVKIKIRFPERSLGVTLFDKGGKAAVELFRHWPVARPLTPNLSAPQRRVEKDDEPLGELYFFALKGKIEMESEKDKLTLKEPVVYHYTREQGVRGPIPVKKSPEWVNPASDKSKKAAATYDGVEKVRLAIANHGVAKGIADALFSSQPAVLQAAAASALAIDDALGGIRSLTNEKHKEVRGVAVRAIVHYLGRDSLRHQQVYQALLGLKYKAGEAAIILELLYGFGREAQLRPETYSLLITYLNNERLAIRQLAAWNLGQFVPENNIDFDATANEESRTQAQAAWRKLIPEGKVPSGVK